MTFSLIPDFLSARLSGSLATVERIVGIAASAKSLQQAADVVRGLDICLPGAMRWLRRRIVAVHKAIAAVEVITLQLSHSITKDRLHLADLRRALPPRALLDIPAPLGFLGTLRTNDKATLRSLVPGFVEQIASDLPQTIAANTMRGLISSQPSSTASSAEVKQCPFETNNVDQLFPAFPPAMKFVASGTQRGGLVKERRRYT